MVLTKVKCALGNTYEYINLDQVCFVDKITNLYYDVKMADGTAFKLDLADTNISALYTAAGGQ